MCCWSCRQLRLINAALFEAAPVLTAAALVPTVIGETVSLPAAAPSTSSPPDAPFGARQIVAAMTVEQVGGVAASLLIVTESGRALRASVTPSLKAVLKPAGDLVPPAALAVMSSGTMYIAGDGQDGVVAQLNSASGEYEVKSEQSVYWGWGTTPPPFYVVVCACGACHARHILATLSAACFRQSDTSPASLHVWTCSVLRRSTR